IIIPKAEFQTVIENPGFYDVKTYLNFRRGRAFWARINVRRSGRATRLPNVAPAAMEIAKKRAFDRINTPASSDGSLSLAPTTTAIRPLKRVNPGTNEIIPAVVSVTDGTRSQRATSVAATPTA